MVLAAAAAATLAACNGIFGGIYDQPVAAEDLRYGFVEEDADGRGGTLVLDVRPYDRWTFVDFAMQRVDTAHAGEAAPARWDVALHRFDASAGTGAVAETGLHSVDEAGWETDGLTFVADVDSAVMVDLSHMVEGEIGYDSVPVNPVLSHWVDVDLSQMPPIYTPSGKVYMLRTADGRLVALQMTEYMDAAGRKGVVTIKYRHP